jgi:hypothetical protein
MINEALADAPEADRARCVNELEVRLFRSREHRHVRAGDASDQSPLALDGKLAGACVNIGMYDQQINIRSSGGMAKG